MEELQKKVDTLESDVSIALNNLLASLINQTALLRALIDLLVERNLINPIELNQKAEAEEKKLIEFVYSQTEEQK